MTLGTAPQPAGDGLTFDDGTPIYCEWTPTGPDKSLIWACGMPATYDDSPRDAWYCAQHAPGLWARLLRRIERMLTWIST